MSRTSAPVGARPVTADRPGVPEPAGPPASRRGLLVALFLAPALLALGTLVAYPIVYTVWLSLHNADGSRFVGLANYVTMFTSESTRKAMANNAIWVVVAPSLVTVVGLVLAVLTERVRLATAVKTVLFMPMAISFLAAGVTFRMVYDESPDRGVANAVAVAAHDAVRPPAPYHGAVPREGAAPVDAGGALLMPLVGLPAERVPADAVPAAVPAAGPGLRGVVWLDFTPGGGGVPGGVDAGEWGLPGVVVEAVRDGTVVARTRTAPDGTFAFDVEGVTARLAAENFTEPFNGLTWLGPTLVTPAIIGAYIWIWAGFALVLISAGLAALPREALEAARVDGASEWQVFRRVTVPLVRPVLVVVFVTLVINVLKIFDLILVIAPESAQDDANVVALEMYRVSFGGGLDFGLGSALGVLLFLFVLPAMLLRIRSLRREVR